MDPTGDLFSTFTMVGAAFLVYTIVNLIRHAANFGNPVSRNAVVTQLVAWVGGVLAAVLMAQADIAEGLPVFGTTLGDLDFPSLVVVGLLFASVGGAFKDFLAARDDTQTAAVPPLMGDRTYVNNVND